MNRVEAALSRSAANPAYMANDWYANAIRADGGKLLALNLDPQTQLSGEDAKAASVTP